MGKLIERIDVNEHRRMSPGTLSRAARKEVLTEFLRRMGQPIIPEKKKADLACDVHRVIQEYHKAAGGKQDGHDHSAGMTDILKVPVDQERLSIGHGVQSSREQGAVQSNLCLNTHPNIPPGYAPAVNPEPFGGTPMCEERELTAELAPSRGMSEVSPPNMGDQGTTTEAPCTILNVPSSYPAPELSLQPYPPVRRQLRGYGVGFNHSSQETHPQQPHFPTVEVLQLRHGAITALTNTTPTPSTPTINGNYTSSPQHDENLPNPEPPKYSEAWMSDNITFHALEAFYLLHPTPHKVRDPMDLATARAALISMKRVIGLDMETCSGVVVDYMDDDITAEEEVMMKQFRTATEAENPMFPVLSFVLGWYGNHVISERACWLVIVVMEIRGMLRKNKREGQRRIDGNSMDVDVQMAGLEQVAEGRMKNDRVLLEYEEYMRQLVEEVLGRMRVSTFEVAATRERVSDMVSGVLGL